MTKQKPKEKKPMPQHKARSLAEVERLTGISRSTLRRMIQAGTLKTIKLANSVRVPHKEYLRLTGD
jgi:excisionase family DNA binding protein